MADKKKTPAQEKASKIAAKTRRQINEQSPPEDDGDFVKSLYTEDEALIYMNQRFAVVANYGGKCLIWDKDAKPGMLELRQPREVRTELMHMRVESHDMRGNKACPMILDWWLKNPKKRQYPTAKFLPGMDLSDDSLNLWRGWNLRIPNYHGADPYQPLKVLDGDKHKGFLNYIYEVLCCEDETAYEYILNWMARAVQMPYAPGEAALVFTGSQGAGKTFFSEHFGALFGDNAMLFGESDRITQKFNSLMSKCVFLGAEEAYFSGNKAAAAVMKYLLTSSTRIYENKGVEATSGRNCVHLVMTSNREYVASVEASDRRHLIMSVSDGRVRDNEYFRAIAEALADGGYDSLWTELRRRDISKFYPGDIPMTNAKRRHICYSLESPLEFWYEVISYGEMVVGNGIKLQRFGGGEGAKVDDDNEYPNKPLFGATISWRHIYNAYLQEERRRGRKHSTSSPEFRQHILQALPEGVRTQSGGGGSLIGGRITIPTQAQCLQAFDERIINPYMKDSQTNLHVA